MNKAYVIKIQEPQGCWRVYYYARFCWKGLFSCPIATIRYGNTVARLSDAKLYRSKGKALIRARKIRKIHKVENSNIVTVVEVRSESNDKR
jgi:hypothetical protein